MASCEACRRNNPVGAELCDFCGHALGTADVSPVARRTTLDTATVTCTSCKRTNPAGSEICEFCGTWVESRRSRKHVMGLPLQIIPCPHCGHEHRRSETFCDGCRRRLAPYPSTTAVRTCAACKTETPAGDAICQYCGTEA